MLHLRGLDRVRITKVKGHADEGMVLLRRVREVDKLCNDAADEAAAFGRRRVGNAVIDARRNLSGVCGRWCPGILDLHRFFIAISRAVVNHDGRDGTAPDPLVWSAGAHPKRRRLVHAVRDRAFLPRPPGIWDSERVHVPVSAFCAEDIAQWPSTPGPLVKWVSFLGSLHWPAGGLDLGVGGISYVELLILCELWAGERLCLEKAHPRYLRPGRPISVSAVPFGPGIDIWRSCCCIGAMMRSLCLLHGGHGWFLPCSIGAKHCGLRHTGWEKCGHGLTLRPRESASEPFLDELLQLFNITLLGLFVHCLLVHFLLGTVLHVLLVKPQLGGSQCLDVLQVWLLLILGLLRVMVEDARSEVHWVSGSGPGRKRIRLNRKTPAHLAGLGVHSRSRVMLGFQLIHLLIVEGVVMISVMMCIFLLRTGLGWVNFWDGVRPTSPGLHA